MALEDEVRSLVDTLNSALKDGSLGGGRDRDDVNKLLEQRKAARERAENLKFEKAKQDVLKESTRIFGSFNKALAKYTSDMSMGSKVIADSFEKAAEGLNYDNLKLVPDALQNELRKSPMFSKTNIKSLEDTFQFFENIAEKKDLLESGAVMDYLMNGATASAESLEKLKVVADKEGITIKELALQRRRLTKEVEEATIAQQELTRKMKGGILGETVDKFKAAGESMAKLKKAVTAIADGILKTMSPAMKFGTEYMDSVTSALAGMSPVEMAQNVATFRQSIQAAGMSIDDFRSITEQGAFGLTSYTGELKDAVKVQASAFETAKRAGLSERGEMRAFMNTQMETFKRFNMVFSLTSEQFAEMNKQIKNSSAINEQLYRLNKKQRLQAIQDIQQTMLQLRTMGLMQDQALKVVEAMSAIAAKSPRERLKQAAKLQAVGGALGFGAEAGEAAQIMRRGFRGEGDRERFAALQQTMQKGMGDFMSQGLPQEMMAMQLLQTTKLEDLLGPKSAFKDLNTEQFQATKNVEKLMKKRVEQGGQMVALMQGIKAFFSGPIAGMISGIGATLGLIVGGKWLQGAIGGALSGGNMGKSIVTRALGMVMRFLGPVGIIGSVVAAVGVHMKKKMDVGKGPEHEVEAGISDRILSWFGVERDKAEVAREKAVKEYIQAAAEQTQIVLSKGAQELKDLLPNLSKDFKKGELRRGRRTVRVINKEGEEQRVSLSAFQGYGEGRRTRLETRTKVDEIQKAIAMKELEAETLKLNNQKEEAEKREEEIKLMTDVMMQFKDMLGKLENPNYKPVTDVLEKNEAEQKKRDEEALNASKKNVKILWTRVGATQ